MGLNNYSILPDIADSNAEYEDTGLAYQSFVILKRLKPNTLVLSVIINIISLKVLQMPRSLPYLVPLQYFLKHVYLELKNESHCFTMF